jgi:hypothetical protein
VPRRVSSRVRNPPPKLRDQFHAKSAVSLPSEPLSREEALDSSEADLWQAAMDEEMTSLMENGTWTLEELPPGRKLVACKWVYKTKTDPNGKPVRWKARVVAKGFQQRAGVDFDEVYAPVSKQSTLRALLAVVAEEDLELHQLDVKTAFLNGELEETIYMAQPPGYQQGSPGVACRLHKALYGLKQAPRAWYKRLKEELDSMGFKASDADPGLFIKRDGGQWTAVLVHVDDMLVAGKNLQVRAVKEQLGRVFNITDLGECSHYLGMEVARDRAAGTLLLSQKKYTRELLDSFGMTHAKISQVPLHSSTKLSRTEGEPLPGGNRYSELVGGLLYLSVCTRPDISQAVGALARYMSAPTTQHWKAATGVLRYLAGTAGYGIEFGGGDAGLVAYSDADYAGEMDSRKSTTGYLFTLHGGAISWSSRLQQTVAVSTVEAEYMAAAGAIKEGLWLRKLLPELGVSTQKVHICFDNQGAISLLGNAITSSRSKHIDVLHHFARDRVARGEVEISYISTDVMVADSLTKPVPVSKFEFCRRGMGLKDTRA